MQLFKYEEFKVVIAPEALLITAFKDLWDRDKHPEKRLATSELGYIYFLCDPRSDFMQFVDEEVRSQLILLQEGMPKSWKPDKLVKKAIEVYKQLTETTSTLALKDCQKAIAKVRTFLTEFDLNERNDKGGLIMATNQYVSSIEKLNSIANIVYETEKKISKELEELGRLKGQRNKTLLDDGLTNISKLMAK